MYKTLSFDEITKLYQLDAPFDPTEYSPESIRNCLHANGIDVEQEVEIQTGLTHRDQFNRISTCPRYCGFERTDPEWLRSSKVSLEALYKSSDAYVRSMLRNAQSSVSNVQPFNKQDMEEIGLWLDNEYCKDI